MDSNDYLIAFLLNYDVMIHFGTYEALIDAIFTSKLPTDLLLIKFFEFAAVKNKNVDEIYEMIVDTDTSALTVETDKKAIARILEIVGIRELKFKEYDDKACKLALVQFPIVNDIRKKGSEHVGQPLPDPVKGRPKLGWTVCKYRHCGQKFANAVALVTHLEQCNAYTQGYHYYHETAIWQTQLTPEKVLIKNITKCPSYACDHKDFGTPDELIKHLQLLGIEPFWIPGMVFLEDNSVKKEIPENIKLFISEMCVLCLSDNPAVITENCRHHVYCYECFVKNKKYITNVCPICKNKVNAFLPFC